MIAQQTRRSLTESTVILVMGICTAVLGVMGGGEMVDDHRISDCSMFKFQGQPRGALNENKSFAEQNTVLEYRVLRGTQVLYCASTMIV